MIIDLTKSKAKELRQVILEKEHEIPSPRGRQWVADERAPSQLGKTIRNDIIGGNNIEIPSTSFMKKVEQAVTKTDYKQLMKKILDSLQEKGASSVKVHIPHSKKQEMNCTS